MRQSELIGLKWDDIDWDRKTIQVKRQVFRPKGGGFEFTKPKTKSSNRSIVLVNSMIEILKTQHEYVWQMQKSADDEWNDNNLIFPSRVVTQILNCNRRRSFRKLLKISGLPKI